MTDYNPNPPIVVDSNQLPSIIGTNLRYALTAIGGMLAQHGWIMGSTWATISGAILSAAPWVYGVILTYVNKKKLIVTANAAPNSVAKVK